MNLVDENELSKFIKKIVLTMKPELKSNLNPDDVKLLVKLNSKQWLNAQESAYYIGVSPVTFRRWRQKYKIPARTLEGITRWNKHDLDNFWLKKGKEKIK